MDIGGRIERIDAERHNQGLSIQQLADMCQISASTVSRTLAGKTEPTDYTIHAMEQSLGITDKPVGDAIMEHVESDPILERYLNMQEMRIIRLRAHYNMLLAEKNRWIRRLFFLCIGFVVIIIFILAIDMMQSDIGWMRQQLGLGIYFFKETVGVVIQHFNIRLA